MPALTIGRLASLGGVRVDTVRYYERKGLLLPPSRSDSGYRTYAVADVDRLRFILRAKELGFTLTQIGELLNLDRAGRQATAARQVDDLNRRIRELSAMRDALSGTPRLEGDLIRALVGERNLER